MKHATKVTESCLQNGCVYSSKSRLQIQECVDQWSPNVTRGDNLDFIFIPGNPSSYYLKYTYGYKFLFKHFTYFLIPCKDFTATIVNSYGHSDFRN